MDRKYDPGVALSYVYDAFNVAEHADRLVQIARSRLADGAVTEALEMLRQAKRPASTVENMIDSAIEYLELAAKEQP